MKEDVVEKMVEKEPEFVPIPKNVWYPWAIHAQYMKKAPRSRSEGLLMFIPI